MGIFNWTPQVPDTISDEEYASLQERGRKAAPPMFSREAVDRRLASNDQQEKRDLS